MTHVSTRIFAVAAAAACVVLGLSAPSASAQAQELSRPGDRRPASPAAHVWITTPDGSKKLTDSGSVSFGRTAPGHETVIVDPTRKFQTMTGFGGSLTDSSVTVLSELSPKQQDATMHQLFDPRTGDGLNFLRQPIGASDFVTDAAYTYDDLPAGSTDYLQQHFSIAHDRTAILPMLRQALKINPHITVMASPWSPPAWMKTGGSLVGGQLIDEPSIYSSYALYLTKFVQAYRHAGVPIHYLSVQPQNRTPSGYPGTDLSARQEEKVIEVLGPMLRAAGLHTKILAFDHNWAEHPNDIAATPPSEVQDTNNYPQEVLSSPAARYVAGTAYHCYYGDPGAMTTLHNQFPKKDIFFTECSGSQSGDPTKTFSDTLKWDARNLEIGATRNWAKLSRAKDLGATFVLRCQLRGTFSPAVCPSAMAPSPGDTRPSVL